MQVSHVVQVEFCNILRRKRGPQARSLWGQAELLNQLVSKFSSKTDRPYSFITIADEIPDYSETETAGR